MPSAMPARRPAAAPPPAARRAPTAASTWKSTRRACCGTERCDRGRVRVLQLRRPVGKSGPCASASAPRSRSPQALALAVPVGPKRSRGRRSAEPRRRAAAQRVSPSRRRPGRWSVARASRPRARRGRRPRPRCSVVEVGVLGDPLHPQVQRVLEAPGGRQVRRRLHRRHGLGRVQRIDQHEAGAVLGRRPDRQVREVDQVADAPGPRRAHAVQLGGQAPGAAPAHPLRQAHPRRGDDQRPADCARCDRARRVWYPSGRSAGISKLASPTAGRRSAGGVQFSSWCSRPGGRRSRGRSRLHRVTVRDVHLDDGRAALAGGQARRQHPPPRPSAVLERRRGASGWSASTPSAASTADDRRPDQRGGPASPRTRWRCRTRLPGRAGTVRVRAPAHPGRYHRALSASPGTEDPDPE